MAPQGVRYWSPCSLIFDLLLATTFTQLATSQSAVTEENCSDSFYHLEISLLSRTQNRFELLKSFFPSKGSHPVFVEVNYTFVRRNDSSFVESKLWYWSQSEFYFVQPLEIFQFTSLLFSNFGYRKGSLLIKLDAECARADHEKLELLTRKVTFYNNGQV